MIFPTLTLYFLSRAYNTIASFLLTVVRCLDGRRVEAMKYNQTLASSVREPLNISLCWSFEVECHFPFPSMRRSTIFCYFGSFFSFLNICPSFVVCRLKILLMVSLSKEIHLPLTNTLFSLICTVFA